MTQTPRRDRVLLCLLALVVFPLLAVPTYLWWLEPLLDPFARTIGFSNFLSPGGPQYGITQAMVFLAPAAATAAIAVRRGVRRDRVIALSFASTVLAVAYAVALVVVALSVSSPNWN